MLRDNYHHKLVPSFFNMATFETEHVVASWEMNFSNLFRFISLRTEIEPALAPIYVLKFTPINNGWTARQDITLGPRRDQVKKKCHRFGSRTPHLYEQEMLGSVGRIHKFSNK